MGSTRLPGAAEASQRSERLAIADRTSSRQHGGTYGAVHELPTVLEAAGLSHSVGVMLSCAQHINGLNCSYDCLYHRLTPIGLLLGVSRCLHAVGSSTTLVRCCVLLEHRGDQLHCMR